MALIFQHIYKLLNYRQLLKSVIFLFIIFQITTYTLKAQKLKFGVNLTYDLYANLDEIEGVNSSWSTMYTYNYGSYYYTTSNLYWPYDQLNMDISMQIGKKYLSFEPFYSFTLIKGWYGVSFDGGKYVADEPVIYQPISAQHLILVDGEEYLYANGSGRQGQNRFGINLLLGDEIKIGTGIWWQKQKTELYKSMAYNRYWYNEVYSKPGYDAFVTDNDEIYVLEPAIETIYKNRILFPLILRWSEGYFSSHITFIFQKPFQVLMGGGFYF